MKARKILFYIFLILSIATNVLIIVESSIGGSGSASQSASLSDWFMKILEAIGISITDVETFRYVFRKLIGHFLLFGFSGVFTSLSLIMSDYLMNKFKWKNILFCLGLGVVIALISELIQAFVPGRFGTFTDVFIDLAGYIGFAGIVYLIYYLVKRKSKKTNEAV